MRSLDSVSRIDPYEIIKARPEHVNAIPGIELAAAQLLKPYAPEHVLEETTTERVLLDAVAGERLWIALSKGTPVGFALVELLPDGQPHLEELDVHPAHGRRGIGTALVSTVCAWARARGFRSLTLTTFRAPRWNMPFYSRLGFVAVPVDRLTPALESVVAHEAARGLVPASRVAMEFRCEQSRD